MSTRCQIGFYNPSNTNLLKPDRLLYRHSDGYPGTVNGKQYGVLPDLVPFLKMFNERRGLDDVEYAAAWAMHHLIDRHIQGMANFRKKMLKDDPNYKPSFLPEDGKDCLGHGVSDAFHGDIEYYYAVQGNTLKVYETNLPYDDSDISEKHFKLIKTVKLGAKRKHG